MNIEIHAARSMRGNRYGNFVVISVPLAMTCLGVEAFSGGEGFENIMKIANRELEAMVACRRRGRAG